jgi:hypothetical protein
MDHISVNSKVQLQYAAIMHYDHYIDLTGQNYNHSNSEQFDNDGDPVNCRRCRVRIPRHIMKAYKVLIEMMRAGDPDNCMWDTGSRHFFRRPTTN